jgi:hypothetical protein
MQIHSVGIDLGKTRFHLVALGVAGKVLVRKKFTQKQLLTFTPNMQTITDRPGSLFRGARPWPSTAEERTRGPADRSGSL